MKEEKKKISYRGSYTIRELARINRELHLMEQPTMYEKRLLAGDYGFKASMKGCQRNQEWFDRRMRLQARKRMVEQELIKLTEFGKKVKARLTGKGRIAVLKHEMLMYQDDLPEGDCCLVSYDIPEDLKSIRDQFRFFLKQAGFEMVHLSLWKCSKDIVSLMKDFVKELGISRWVNVSKAQM